MRSRNRPPQWRGLQRVGGLGETAAGCVRTQFVSQSSGGFIAIPSFTASIVFELTQLDATVTRQFN